MKGDVILVKQCHIDAAAQLIPEILPRIQASRERFIITVAGESGSGKSETAAALKNALKELGFESVILGQDDYFYLPPKQNTARRKTDPDWLGPHAEVDFATLAQNLREAKTDAQILEKPLVDYHQDKVEMETITLQGVKVVIAEGTYTSLLRDADVRIFIARNWIKTREDRRKRNRGDEMQDPFTEQILATEHKIIAGHQYLADFIITDNFEVLNVMKRGALETGA